MNWRIRDCLYFVVSQVHLALVPCSHINLRQAANSVVYFQSSRQGFGRGGANKNNNNNTTINTNTTTTTSSYNPPKMNNAQSPVPPAPQPAHLPNSTSPIPAAENTNTSLNDNDAPKYFFQEKYAQLNVKGNFLTLCACPKNVELGEWLAHQSESHPQLVFDGRLELTGDSCSRRAVSFASWHASGHTRAQWPHRSSDLQRKHMPYHVCWTVSGSEQRAGCITANGRSG